MQILVSELVSESWAIVAFSITRVHIFYDKQLIAMNLEEKILEIATHDGPCLSSQHFRGRGRKNGSVKPT